MKRLNLILLLCIIGLSCCYSTAGPRLYDSVKDELCDKSLMYTYIDFGGSNNTFYADEDPNLLMDDPLSVNDWCTAFFNFGNLPTQAWWEYKAGPGRRFTKVVVSYVKAADSSYYQYPNWGSRIDVQDQDYNYLSPTETWVDSSTTDGFRWHKDTYEIDSTEVTSVIISMVVDWAENNFHPRVGTVDLTVEKNYITEDTVDTIEDDYWMTTRTDNFDPIPSTDPNTDPLDMGSGSVSVIRSGTTPPAWWIYEAEPGKCFKKVTISYTGPCPAWGGGAYNARVRLQNQHWEYLTPRTHTNDGALTTYQWNVDTYEFDELVTNIIVSSDYWPGDAYWTVRVGTVEMELADYSASYQKLLSKGLQIQSFTRPGLTGWWNQSWWDDSYFTTIMSDNFGQDPNLFGTLGDSQFAGISYSVENIHPGIGNGNDDCYPYFSTYEYKTEQDMDDPAEREEAAIWMTNVRGTPGLSHVITKTTQLAFGDTDENLRAYMEEAKPDMMMFDYYPWGQTGSGNSPALWYSALMRFRGFGLGGIDGTGDLPIPYGTWIQNYTRTAPASGEPPVGYRPSESEIRLSMFAPWTMGYTCITGYMYDDVGDSPAEPLLFNGSGSGSTRTSEYYYQAEANRQSRILGPALIRLLSTDVRIIEGPNSDTNNDIDLWTAGSADPNYYMTAIDVVNNGSTNGGDDGDVLIGYFEPLSEDFDGNYVDQKYFMITNGLAAANGSAADTEQTITVTFDFGSSGITALQRINRITGAVEDVPLTALGGTQYELSLTLDGGTGDLFKFDTGAPFVGKFCGAIGYLDGDLSSDCYVNFLDFAVMAEQWLDEMGISSLETIASQWLECNDSDGPCYYFP